MKSRDVILTGNHEIAVCGVYAGGDNIHVGIYWNYENEKKIFHFMNGNFIPVENVNDPKFENYIFNPIDNFHIALLPSLIALSELISDNKINNFSFNRQGVIYNGGKFEFNTGNFNSPQYEKFINCGVFVIALFNTFDYKLLEWNSWPNQVTTNYLDSWLTSMCIPTSDWPIYYMQVKEIRGKHIIVCPSTISKPSQFTETEILSNNLINLIR